MTQRTNRDILDDIMQKSDLNYLTAEFFEGRMHAELYCDDEILDTQKINLTTICEGEVSSEVTFFRLKKVPTHILIFLDSTEMLNHKITTTLRKGENLRFKWAIGVPLDPSRR